MKGPGLKLDLDVRRLWKCPQTGQTIRLSGDVAAKSIKVEGKEVFMQLVEEKRSLYRDPYHFDYFELAEEEQSSSERAAAAARSTDENQKSEESPASEQPSSEVSSATAPTPEPEKPSHDTKESKSAEEKPQEDEDSFGGGLL